MGTSSSSGHSAGDGHTCLSQTPECRTHPKARLHLQAALQVKIICSHPQILSYSQPWLPCDFAWRAGAGGAELGEPPGPAVLHTPCPPLARSFASLSACQTSAGGSQGGGFWISPFISLGFSSWITESSGRTGWRDMGVSKDWGLGFVSFFVIFFFFPFFLLSFFLFLLFCFSFVF